MRVFVITKKTLLIAGIVAVSDLLLPGKTIIDVNGMQKPAE